MRNLSKTGRYISNRIGKAIEAYDLIRDKDRILVAVSGGKDSLSLLRLLNERRKWAPVNYKLIAVHVDTDYEGGCVIDKKKLKRIFEKEGIEYHFSKIKIKQPERGVNCFWCSWNRRKALFTLADRLKCTKVALGHHMDDIIETLMLNLFFHGEFSAMNPKQELFKGKIVIIRPLCFVEERQLKRFAKECAFDAEVSGCPHSDVSKRRMMKDIIKKLEPSCEYVKKNIFRSTSRIKDEYLRL
jgi:tRNA(Ile)-lysidine synthase TilS/MesJ